MRLLRTLIGLVLLGCLLCTSTAMAAARPNLTVQFYKARTPVDEPIRKLLMNTVEIRDFVTFVNQQFKLRYPIKLRFGDMDGPLYDLQAHSIDIPYSFMGEMIKIFQAARYGRTGLTPTQAATDTLIYVLFHELGHVFIDMYSLPLFAKEEDVADYFATTLLLDSFEGGAEIALSTADMFNIASRYYAKQNSKIYWDEHSLDAVRARSLLCHVYGSNPKHFQQIAKHYVYVKQNTKQCITRYSQLLAGWTLQLAPYIRTRTAYAPKVVQVYTLAPTAMMRPKGAPTKPRKTLRAKPPKRTR